MFLVNLNPTLSQAQTCLPWAVMHSFLLRVEPIRLKQIPDFFLTECFGGQATRKLIQKYSLKEHLPHQQ